jgi:hypothetical protein
MKLPQGTFLSIIVETDTTSIGGRTSTPTNEVGACSVETVSTLVTRVPKYPRVHLYLVSYLAL